MSFFRRAEAELTQDDTALLERVTVLISPYCLIGWGTASEAWSP